MSLLSEIDVAKRIGHPYFDGEDVTDTAKKKRVRQLARQANIPPVIKKHDLWLFHEDDLELLLECRSDLRNETTRRTGRSRGHIAESAFEKARKLTIAP
jgi:hypothetical protein